MMLQKGLLAISFFAAASFFYIVAPSWGCGVQSKCAIYCVGSQVTCNDVAYTPGSCECFTEPSNNGYAYCHSHCSGTTGQDTFCDELG